jgi:hypothetical protein
MTCASCNIQNIFVVAIKNIDNSYSYFVLKRINLFTVHFNSWFS